MDGKKFLQEKQILKKASSIFQKNLFIDKMYVGYDYIKATRYGKGGSVTGVSWKSRCLSIVGNYIAKFLYKLPLTDLTNGFRAVKLNIYKEMDLKEPGFAIIMEELYYVKFITDSFCEMQIH